MKRLNLIFIFILCAGLLNCGKSLEVNIKDTYIFTSPSVLKPLYPIKAGIDTESALAKIKITDNLADIIILELKGKNLFETTTVKGSAEEDIVLFYKIEDYKDDKNIGLKLSLAMYKMPENLRIYCNVVTEKKEGTKIESADEFVTLLKNGMNISTQHLQASLESMAKAGNLPVKASTRQISLAVLEFQDSNEIAKSEGDAAAFSNMLMTGLTKAAHFKVVERSIIDKALTELQFQATGVTDQEKAKQLGNLINADCLVYGNVARLGELIVINIRSVDVKTGELVITDELRTKSKEEIPDLIDQLCKKIASKYR
jgi:TolB-like protein